MHSSVELYDDGYFNYFLGLDTLSVFNSIRCRHRCRYIQQLQTNEDMKGDGKANPDRDQRFVRITGIFDMEKYPERENKKVICTCLVAPEYPQYPSGRSRFCEAACPVTVARREYSNSTEEEIWMEMLDFSRRNYRSGVERFSTTQEEKRVTVKCRRERSFLP